MRILQIVHGFPPREWAGTELVTLNLSQALRERGHQVTVFTRTADPEAQEFSIQEDQVEGLSVVRVVNNYTYLSDFHLLYESSFFDSVFLRLLGQVQPDILHFQHVQHLSIRLLSLAAALGYRTLLTLHDFFFPCHLINLINTQGKLCTGPERGELCVPCLQNDASPEEARQRFLHMEQALQAPDMILTPSTFLARKIVNFFPSLQNKLRVTPLGVKAVPRMAKSRAPGAPLRILYVGVFLPHKGAHVLVEALQGLAPDTFEASLYGTTVPTQQAYVNRLRKETAGLPVHFFDGYPHDHISSILAQCDVLVMPMIWEETFSILTREALMAGLPVIAARRGALPEVVHDDVNGLLFEPDNSDDLRRCLARLIAEPGLVERLRDPDPQMKSLAEYGKDMEMIYQEVTAEERRSPSCENQKTARRNLFAVFLQEQERLQATVHQLKTNNAQLATERDEIRAETLRLAQERDAVLATTQALQNTVVACESELRERDARLGAIYASTTWKLYRGYASVANALLYRPFDVLRRWRRKGEE